MTKTNASTIPLAPNLEANLRAMYDDGLPIPQRLSAALSVNVNIDAYITYLARMARVANKLTWEEIAEPLQITRQTAYARYGQGLQDDQRPIVRVITGAVHPEGNAMWYGLPEDLPRERNYAYTRAECATAYQLARARADARAKELGPDAVVDDGGIDRGSGLFWDLYVGA